MGPSTYMLLNSSTIPQCGTSPFTLVIPNISPSSYWIHYNSTLYLLAPPLACPFINGTHRLDLSLGKL
ncbi:hypothetical protein Lal_00049867 [Lupinus albus]|nr:hypothetical protein Lal_00049867 [Lupinus albus]